jgi:hypothetical protein
MRHHLVVPIFLSLAAATAHAQPAPVATAAAVDVSGTYASTWGPMTLHQDGNHVTGSYAYHGGTIDGTLDGDTLRFAWQEDNGSGRGELVRASDGGFVGSWGTGADDHSGGLWRLTPASAAEPSTEVASTAAPDDGGPHAGNWSFEVNLPVDAMFAPNQTLIGVGGVELGLGQRLTDRWYLGVTGGVEGLVGTNFEATNTPSMRLRGGVEARYIFHQGSGTASVNDGPAFGVPRYDWIGANAGLESLDGGTTHGEYAELSLGSDMWLGRAQVGMYLKAGVSVEPTGAYGSVPMSDDGTTGTAGLAAEAPPAQDASTMATYVALGWRLAFG